MAERATVFNRPQIGVETTPGTAVAANKQLQALSIEPGPQGNVDMFRGMGYKFATVASPGQEWTEANLTGAATFTEMIYPLSSVITAAIPSQPDAVNAPTVYEWLFVPSATGADSPKTFTVEFGSSSRASKFAYGLVKSFGLNFTRQSIAVSGSMLGQILQIGQSLTSSPTALDLIPILPKQVDLYLETAWDTDADTTFGQTQLNRGFSANFQIGDRYAPVWPLVSSNASFAAHVEQPIPATCALMLAADATGEGFQTQLHAGQTIYLQLSAIGDTIEDTQKYEFRLRMAAKINAPASYSDQDGVYATGYTLEAVSDANWGGKAFDILVRNTISAL